MCTNFKQNLLVILEDALSSTETVIQTIDPNWGGLAQLKQDSEAAITAITAWQEGTDAENIVEIIDDVIADISLFPVPVPYQGVITIALDGVKSIIVLLEEHSTGATQQAAATVIARTANVPAKAAPSTVGAQEAGPVHAKVAWVPPTKLYEGTRQWAVDWNKEVGSRPELAHAKVAVPKKWGILP